MTLPARRMALTPDTHPVVTVARVPFIRGSHVRRTTTASGHFLHAKGECPPLRRRWVSEIPGRPIQGFSITAPSRAARVSLVSAERAFSEKGAHSPRWISALISGGLPEILVWPGPRSARPFRFRRWRSRVLGVMKNGPVWRISRVTIRRFLLGDGFVMAAAGTDPPWPPLCKEGKLGDSRRGIRAPSSAHFQQPSRMLGLDLALGRPSVKPSTEEACAMRDSNRRGFLATSAAAAAVPLLPDLGFLAPVSQAAATDTRIDPNQVRHSPSIGQLIKLIQTTPRDKCVPVFLEQLLAGLSYQDLLSALLLATIEHGDPHQVLGVYSAHRVSSEARVEERLLPLFWALDRIVIGFQRGDAKPLGGAHRRLAEGRAGGGRLPGSHGRAGPVAGGTCDCRARTGTRPSAGDVPSLGMWRQESDRLARASPHHGGQHMEDSRRTGLATCRTGATLPLAGTLQAQGGQHLQAEPRACGKTVAKLPADWAAKEPERGATLEVFNLLRQGETDAVCDLICTQLSSGRVKAGAVWDAIHLVAADLLFRYKTGGVAIGGYLIHAVTSTNALRCGFECSDDDRVRLLMLLQSGEDSAISSSSPMRRTVNCAA